MAHRSFAIIGGGAAGIFAAIQAAENKRYSNITVFEASSSLLQKVKISGGGRCNVTHNCFDPQTLILNYPRGKQFLKRCFYKFQPQDTVDFFLKRNVKLKAESDGRMFPITDSSQTIIDCFVSEIKRHNITIHYNSPIQEINKLQNGFELIDNNNVTYNFDSVLLATGSSKRGYKLAKSLGHTIIETVPSLFTFKISDERLDSLSGVSCSNITATLILGKKKYNQTGPIVITHWGLSGPAILKLSAFAARELYEHNYQADLKINFAPNLNQDEILRLINKTKSEHSHKNICTIQPFDFPKSLWRNIIRHLCITPDITWGELSKKEINKLSEQIQNSIFQVEGKGVFKDEFVTCGGVSLKEIDSNSMQSKICDNLFFAGEILDIDGVTGGFNFQAAWTTGFIAGKSA